MNATHFHGSKCSICQNTLRYKSSHNCVNCAKINATKRYETKVGGEPPRRTSNNLRLAAKAAGLKTYQGLPCERGHNGMRVVRNGSCVECDQKKWYIYPAVRKRMAILRNKPEQKIKRSDQSRRWREQNPDRASDLSAKKRTRKRKATPAWSDPKARRDVYRLAQKMTRETGIAHHVDHIVPLKSKYVSGLHCEANLQVIPATDNMRKHNCWWPDMS